MLPCLKTPSAQKNNFMKYKLLFLLLLSFSAFSQKFDNKYYQFELGIPFRVNTERGQIDENGKESEYFFLPDGLNAKAGYGIHFEQWASVGIHTGIDWKAEQQLVAVPVFVNFKLSPLINDESAIVLQFGLGKATAIGRGDLFGTYKRFNLGYQNGDYLNFFIDYSEYRFEIANQDRLGIISLGVGIVIY